MQAFGQDALEPGAHSNAGAFDQAPDEPQQHVSSDDHLSASELEQQKPEDTHEIDVDDVVVEDK